MSQHNKALFHVQLPDFVISSDCLMIIEFDLCVTTFGVEFKLIVASHLYRSNHECGSSGIEYVDLIHICWLFTYICWLFYTDTDFILRIFVVHSIKLFPNPARLCHIVWKSEETHWQTEQSLHRYSIVKNGENRKVQIDKLTPDLN